MDPDTLLRHAGFVRAIARGLLPADEADDVVQDTMLAAWRRPPGDPSRARAWLGAVARRLSLKRRRGDRRRDARERGAARTEALPSVADVAGQLEIQRRVVEAVAALEEPYRSTVVHRFFHGRSVAEIAAALGVPGKTVESRLTRALAMLRARLDAGPGGRRAWSVALLPLAWPRSGVGMFGGLAMAAKTKAVLAAAVLVAALGVWGSGYLGRTQPVDRAGGRTTAVAPEAPIAAPDAGTEAGVPPSAADVADGQVPTPAAPIPAGTILGRILDADGEPACGARVLVVGNLTRDGITPFGGGTYEVSRSTAADDDGNYRFEGLAPGGYYLQAEHEGHAPQRSAHGYVLGDKEGANWSIRLARGGTVVVVVRDVAGVPRPDVEVETCDAKSRTDLAGRVVFPHLAAVVCPVIVRVADDSEARIARVEDGVTTELEIVLGSVLRGTVALEDGTPVSGAMWASLDLPDGAQCIAEGFAETGTGSYEFRWLGPGEWKVRMGNTGIWSESRSVRIGSEPVTRLDLRLLRPSIAGRLTLSGAGFSPGMVNLFPAEGRRGGIRGIAVAEDGSFVFHDLSPGRYVVVAQPHKSGYGSREVPVKVEAGQRLDGLEIPVEEIRYGEVELDISDENGALTEAVQMFEGAREGRIRSSTSMSPAPVSPGRFRLTLECGKRVITVRGKKADVKVDVDVEEGKTVYRTVRLP